MAGAGVSVGGAGMLRARRRDVSVKPNRKLDRKSSRGMIYENEELRLRTIHINAEVEQGQNDIKKLRRENEQLRREIWSLRDEYDKLEDILKSQTNREGSEDYEDRSEDEDRDDDEEAEEHSDYSIDENEEAEEDCYEDEKDIGTNDEGENDPERNQEERLENDENQKISSEKVNSSNHRLHVEFDDLSVVDEEEELKREKERKEVAPLDEIQSRDTTKETDLLRMEPRNNYQCFPPPRYGSSGTSGSGNPYYSDYPFGFPSNDVKEFTEMLPIDSSPMLLSTCPGLYNDSFNHVANFEPPCVANLQLNYGSDLRQDSNYGESPIGWQRTIFAPGTTFQGQEVYQSEVVPAQPPGMFQGSMFDQSGQSAGPTNIPIATNIPRGARPDVPADSPGRNHAPVVTGAILPSLYQRRNLLQKQPNTFYRETIIPGRAEATGIEVSTSADALTRNGWDFGPAGNGICNARMYRDMDDRKNGKEGQRERTETGDNPMEQDGHQRVEDSNVSGYETVRPKHFFAPLPAKIQHGRQDSGERTTTRTTNPGDSPSATFYETYGTGKSSSSERTSSTVISGRHFQPHGQPAGTLTEIFRDSGEKGSADICVNGAVAGYPNEGDVRDTSEGRTYKSSENLLIGSKDDSRDGSSRQGSNNPLVKSVSCQDLSSEPLQNALLEMARTFQTDNKSQKFAKSDNRLDNPATGSVKPFRSQLNVTLKCPYAENECGRYSPEIPEIPKLPTIDYRLFNNPFLKTFDPRGGNYGNYEICSPVTRPLSIQVNENSFDRGKSFQQQAPSIDYSSPVLTHSFARQLNLEEGTVKSTRPYTASDVETDRHRGGMLSTTSQTLGVDPRIVASPKLRQEFQVTSFEQPNPRSLNQGLSSYDLESWRRLPTSATTPITPNHRKLYQNVPFVPGSAGMFCSTPQNPLRMFYDSMAQKVPAQTQTSIDGGSNNGDEIIEGDGKKSKTPDPEEPDNSGSPTSARRKRVARKERSTQKTDKRPLSPAAQRRRLRKQSSIDAADVPLEQNTTVSKSKKFSVATANSTGSENLEDKNESRSSSSGQESPRKEHNRRVSTYFTTKKRPSLVSVKTTRSSSVDNTKDNYASRGLGESMDTTNSERERTNSASSREAATGKARKSSVSSGKVPWCACWGNGCV